MSVPFNTVSQNLLGSFLDEGTQRDSSPTKKTSSNHSIHTPPLMPLHVMRGNLQWAGDVMRSWMDGMLKTAEFALQNPMNPFAGSLPVKMTKGYVEFLQQITDPHAKHEFDFTVMDRERITDIHEETGIPASKLLPRTIDEQEVGLNIEIIDTLPFGRLKHFNILDENGHTHDTPRPPLLIVAPMSGHFDTLLTGTVYRMMQDYDVYITDWTDIKEVPLSAGKFDLNDYTSYLKDRWLPMINERHQPSEDELVPTVHTLAVCQPGVPLFCAVAMMSEDKSPHTPISMTLMGSPIDTRISPTEVNKTATDHPLSWFQQNAIQEVPIGYKGAGRLSYSGQAQIVGFMLTKADDHKQALSEMGTGLTFAPWNEVATKMNFENLTVGSHETALRRAEFYQEYLTVMDMSAEYYLHTIGSVFQDHLLPRGLMGYEDPETGELRTIDPSYIDGTAIMTIEGKKDDITGLGQTSAAHDLTPNLSDNMRKSVQQEGVGHYGLFSGKTWRREIAPQVIDFTRRIDKMHGLDYHMRSETVRSLKHAGILENSEPLPAPTHEL